MKWKKIKKKISLKKSFFIFWVVIIVKNLPKHLQKDFSDRFDQKIPSQDTHFQIFICQFYTYNPQKLIYKNWKNCFFYMQIKTIKKVNMKNNSNLNLLYKLNIIFFWQSFKLLKNGILNQFFIIIFFFFHRILINFRHLQKVGLKVEKNSLQNLDFFLQIILKKCQTWAVHVERTEELTKKILKHEKIVLIW